MCPDLIAGCHKYLDLGVREYRRADVPAVHHDSFPLSESVQTLIDIFPDKRDRRDRADVAGHLQRADLLFYASVSDERALCLEIKIQFRQGSLEGSLVNGSVLPDKPFLKGVQGNSTVESPGVQIKESEVFRYQSGKRALACR